MALTGLDIFKLLPKTNCKKCGMPTCLAFAMQLAQKKAKLDKCPDVSEEARRYGKLTVLTARMNPDLAMGDELLKKTGAGNLFMVFGEPVVVKFQLIHPTL